MDANTPTSIIPLADGGMTQRMKSISKEEQVANIWSLTLKKTGLNKLTTEGAMYAMH